jgi:hypothetical protein
MVAELLLAARVVPLRPNEDDMKALEIGQFEEVQAEFSQILLLAESTPPGPERDIMQLLLTHARQALEQSRQVAELEAIAQHGIHRPEA